ncbi:MAG: Ku protein, partial [Ginsengibacter sp.]
MKAIWTGAIGFGLVNIPVKMYSATESSNLDLDMLDKKDHAHIKFMRVNENTGKEIAWENIVKGYKYHDDYVILDDKDFELASAKKTKTIEISDFVKEEEISSLYYETPYYLEPDKSGTRPYKLLLDALKKTKKVGVSTFVMRNKENLAIL